MTFAELQAEVLSITRRPDLIERIQGGIRAATLKIHHSDFFYKDLVEVPVEFSEVTPVQSFVPAEVLPSFRKAKYLRVWCGDVNGSPGQFLEHIQIENSLDSYNYIKENVFYMAGTNLQIRSNPPVQRILFGAYVHPVVAPMAQYKSWIADEYPYAIIYEASRTIFRSIGQPEQATEYGNLAYEILAEIKVSSVDDMPIT